MFLDLSLVFGASSSPSLYDSVAKVILDLSRIKAGTLGGIVAVDPPVYFHYAWPSLIQSNKPNKEGVRFASKLTFMEASAMLAGILATPISIACHSVLLTTDNIGCY